jgi:hypothetical protein
MTKNAYSVGNNGVVGSHGVPVEHWYAFDRTLNISVAVPDPMFSSDFLLPALPPAAEDKLQPDRQIVLLPDGIAAEDWKQFESMGMTSSARNLLRLLEQRYNLPVTREHWCHVRHSHHKTSLDRTVRGANRAIYKRRLPYYLIETRRYGPSGFQLFRAIEETKHAF